MTEENLVRHTMIKKANLELQQLSEYNIQKVAIYINELKEKQDKAVKMINTGLIMGRVVEMESHDKIVKAIDNSLNALKEMSKGEKRKGLYYLDHVKDDIQAAIYLLLAEIEDDEKQTKIAT